jgi:hypothetical protein
MKSRRQTGFKFAYTIRNRASAFEVRCNLDLIQPRVERMRGTSRQLLRRNPHRGLLQTLSVSAHRHPRDT